MTDMRYLLTLCFLSITLMASAQQNIVQSLQNKQRATDGTVTIHQDEKITELIGTIHGRRGNATSGTGEEKKALKARGYRVQVYAGNNSRVARSEAHSMAARVKGEFPDLPVYTFFQPPRWLCRVGDFRSIEEADAAMRRLKSTGVFKEVSIVREQINIPLE
jgi:hypothetical protein